MDRRELEPEFEALDVESKRITDMLGGLKRVETPSNFEFGVRARIANGAPTRQSGLIPFLKVAAPLSLILIVAMFVVFYRTPPNVTTSDVDHTPLTAAPAQTEMPTARPEPSVNSEALSGPRLGEADELALTAGAAENVKPVPRTGYNPRPRTRSTPDNRSDGTSRVDALRPANTINPPEFRGTLKTTSNSDSLAQPEVPVRELLEMLGVSADKTDGGWRVKSTVEGSLSRRSGVQSGDMIEAIDGHTVIGETFKGSGGKTMRVRREGKVVDIKLSN